MANASFAKGARLQTCKFASIMPALHGQTLQPDDNPALLISGTGRILKPGFQQGSIKGTRAALSARDIFGGPKPHPAPQRYMYFRNLTGMDSELG